MMLFMDKIINWFEIPALDLNRALAFYETILGISLRTETMGTRELAVFPYDRETSTGGCLLRAPEFSPSSKGTIVYLHAGEHLNSVLDRIQGAGGTVVVARTELGPGMGAFAHIQDTEGNRVGLFGSI